MSFNLNAFITAPSQELFHLAKRSDLLDIAAQWKLISVNKSMLKQEVNDFLIQVLVEKEIVNSFALSLVIVVQTGLQLASCKSALNPPVVYSTDRSKAVVPVLLFVALWFILRGDFLYVLPCVILFLCFSFLLVLRLPRLGKRANLSAFRTFVQFVLVWICRFSLPFGVWEGLRFVIVTLPGLFSYSCLQIQELEIQKQIDCEKLRLEQENL